MKDIQYVLKNARCVIIVFHLKHVHPENRCAIKADAALHLKGPYQCESHVTADKFARLSLPLLD